MRILITGANGQLGRSFKELFKEQDVSFIETDVDNLDIRKLNEIRNFTQNNNFTHIFNCAAYNAVDNAETDWKEAYLVNGIGPKNLAIVAGEINAEIVHYSTDYVFDGRKGLPYTIHDSPNPINKYGESKYLGEKLLQVYGNRSYLIRTSWLFGDGENNFALKVISWSNKRNEISIADDEISAPTYADDLAQASLDLIFNRQYGIYHITNSSCSRYDWAEFILKETGWKGKLLRAKQADFKLPAKRPVYSVLDNFCFPEVSGYNMPAWQDATLRFIKKLEITGE